jgi:type VI secretion system protein ImpC
VQLSEVMHCDEFQKLEGTWRGLHYLTQNSETGTSLKIRVLNVKKAELQKDLEKAVEFDQSTLFRKCYEEEYGQLGGEPYGMLVGDYHFGRTADDVNLFRLISNVAAAAHAPFVAGADPKMFNMDSFTELSGPRDLAKIFQGVEYAGWRSFRESEDSRYVALTLPNVLGRLPYGQEFKKIEAFDFEEQVDGSKHSSTCG